jgi:hypothetical protein
MRWAVGFALLMVLVFADLPQWTDWSAVSLKSLNLCVSGLLPATAVDFALCR